MLQSAPVDLYRVIRRLAIDSVIRVAPANRSFERAP